MNLPKHARAMKHRVRRGKWAHKNEVLTCIASISFDFGDMKKFVVQML
jgi:hypothetical protein